MTLTKEDVERTSTLSPNFRAAALALIAERDRLRVALAEATEAGSEIAGFFENSNRAESKGGHQYTMIFMWTLVGPQLDRIADAARAALKESP